MAVDMQGMDIVSLDVQSNQPWREFQEQTTKAMGKQASLMITHTLS